MYSSYQEIHHALSGLEPVTIAVAGAADREVILTVREAGEKNIAHFILVGDAPEIEKLLSDENVKCRPRIIHEADEKEAAKKAARLTGSGQAQIYMKGMINSSDFLKGALAEDSGLRTGGLLSHLAVFEVPGQKKLQFYSDGGINIAPDLEGKAAIIKNAVQALHAIGMNCPKVAVLTANEAISPGMPATVDAAELARRQREAHAFGSCLLEGPIALDVALNREAAEHKGLKSEISGDTDLFIVPFIEAGNMIGKALMYCAGAKMAGVILGAKCPMVMTSRAENAEGKLNSIALACLISTSL